MSVPSISKDVLGLSDTVSKVNDVGILTYNDHLKYDILDNRFIKPQLQSTLYQIFHWKDRNWFCYSYSRKIFYSCLQFFKKRTNTFTFFWPSILLYYYYFFLSARKRQLALLVIVFLFVFPCWSLSLWLSQITQNQPPHIQNPPTIHPQRIP